MQGRLLDEGEKAAELLEIEHAISIPPVLEAAELQPGAVDASHISMVSAVAHGARIGAGEIELGSAALRRFEIH